MTDAEDKPSPALPEHVRRLIRPWQPEARTIAEALEAALTADAGVVEMDGRHLPVKRRREHRLPRLGRRDVVVKWSAASPRSPA